jgi:hypothetical protein
MPTPTSRGRDGLVERLVQDPGASGWRAHWVMTIGVLGHCSIKPLYYHTSYFLAHDDDAGETSVPCGLTRAMPARAKRVACRSRTWPIRIAGQWQRTHVAMEYNVQVAVDATQLIVEQQVSNPSYSPHGRDSLADVA